LLKIFHCYLVNSSSLNSKLILVDRDDLLVDEDGFVLGPDGPQVDGHQQRRREDGPHRHLSLALLVAQAEVTDDQLEKFWIRLFPYFNSEGITPVCFIQVRLVDKTDTG
jgi:hypothetical protein